MDELVLCGSCFDGMHSCCTGNGCYCQECADQRSELKRETGLRHMREVMITPGTKDKKVFKNLARRDHSLIDETVRAELVEAGVLRPDGKGDPNSYIEAEWIRKTGGEVPTAIFAAKHRWQFTRRWYYYEAKGPGIAPEIAERFHQTWGRDVRVDGHCGCPSPLEWGQGFAIDLYHIDTQEGLNAFVELLASIHRAPSEVRA